jgi:hypothetical protein
MKKHIFLILFIFIFQSCKSDYNIYVSKPKLGEDDIFGYKLENFFNGRRKIKKIKITDLDLFKVEFEKIKDTLIKSNPLSRGGEKFGMYKYAFIYSNDTLYYDSTLKGWRYKKKVCLYENLNKKIKDEILNKTESLYK